MLQLLRLNKRGGLILSGNYQYAIICAILIDLINLKKIGFKRQDNNRIIINAVDYRETGDLILDELFITIRDCPKTYTLEKWFNRFVDCYDAFEEIHLESLIQKEIIVENGFRKKLYQFLALSICLIFPLIFIAIIVYRNTSKRDYFKIKTPKLIKQIRIDLHDTLTSLEIPNPQLIGLISILAASGLNKYLVDEEYHDFFIKKYYQFRDFDFNNEDIKILIQYLTKRDPESPITTTSAMDYYDFIELE